LSGTKQGNETFGVLGRNKWPVGLSKERAGGILLADRSIVVAGPGLGDVMLPALPARSNTVFRTIWMGQICCPRTGIFGPETFK